MMVVVGRKGEEGKSGWDLKRGDLLGDNMRSGCPWRRPVLQHGLRHTAHRNLTASPSVKAHENEHGLSERLSDEPHLVFWSPASTDKEKVPQRVESENGVFRWRQAWSTWYHSMLTENPFYRPWRDIPILVRYLSKISQQCRVSNCFFEKQIT